MAKCTVCKRKVAFYTRPYSGESFCKKCFLEAIENKVRVTIAKHEMFDIDDKIAVAVSGGKDSVSLLHILASIEKAFPKVSLRAVTADEGIKGYRDEAVKIAADNCAKLGIEHTIVSFKDIFGYTLDEVAERTKNGKLTPCAYCGVLRRRALNLAARDLGARKMATAHNLDDEIQTFLLNIIHGDPLRIARSGAAFENEENGLIRRVKPFCETLEKEIVLYAYLKGIVFQEIPCPYAGTALRNDARNILNRLEEKHPGVKYTVHSSMNKVRQAIEETIKQTPLKACGSCGEPTANETCQTCQMIQSLEDN